MHGFAGARLLARPSRTNDIDTVALGLAVGKKAFDDRCTALWSEILRARDLTLISIHCRMS